MTSERRLILTFWMRTLPKTNRIWSQLTITTSQEIVSKKTLCRMSKAQGYCAPELRDDYFHAYKRILWLAQHQTPELEEAAKDAASLIDLPLEIINVGDKHLEEQLMVLIGSTK